MFYLIYSLGMFVFSARIKMSNFRSIINMEWSHPHVAPSTIKRILIVMALRPKIFYGQNFGQFTANG